jgi:hypothetical protein
MHRDGGTALADRELAVVTCSPQLRQDATGSCRTSAHARADIS